jgi:4-hydroxybutyryl-CoA dehydratase/vinylacetyl-CoA-Delta-isomerase
MLVERFAAYHRQSYGGCKAGVGDVVIGTAQALAQAHGTERAAHIKDKLVEMVHLNETLYACGIACSAEGKPMASGTFLVDTLLANVCKLNVTRFPYEIARLAQDIAGGLLVTGVAGRSTTKLLSPAAPALLTGFPPFVVVHLPCPSFPD